MNGVGALLKKDWRVLGNLRRLARQQSKFKGLFIGVFALAMLAGLWLMFLDGFHFLDKLGGIGVVIIHHLFALFFFGLGLMLVISSVIIAYATIYHSKEMPFLLLKPLSPGEIMLHKWLEISLLSSWAFFFIIIPFVGAYAWHVKATLFFSIWTMLFSIPFVILCSGIGTILTLFAVRWVPHFRPAIWATAIISIALIWFGMRFYSLPHRSSDEIEFILSNLIPGIKLASYPLWPSWWVSEGIMALSRGQYFRGIMFCSVIIANTGLIGLMIAQTGKAFYYQGWQRILMATRYRRRHQFTPGLPFTNVPFIAASSRALIIKDSLTFIRDPVQWTQGLVFFGLLGLYFFNLRNFNYHLLSPVWRNLIAFLNIFSLSAVMCSFCARFIYPLLSLEGHGFWMIGLSPVTMGRVLITKFASATAGMFIISIGLMAISTEMLGVEKKVQLTAFLIATCMSLALCGLATGMGAIFLDLKQRNPAAIISGFGGTLNLALSLVFMVAVIFPFAKVFHDYYLQQINPLTLRWELAFATAWLLLLTALATSIPLIIGRRSLLAREY